jgi:hypothetical protein
VKAARQVNPGPAIGSFAGFSPFPPLSVEAKGEMAEKDMISKVQLNRWLAPLLVFILALLMRASGLGSFLTVDEPRWIERSQGFAAGLFVPGLECPPVSPVSHGRAVPATGLACTLQVSYPGVTTMWGGALGLLAYYWGTVRPTGVALSTFLQRPLTDEFDPAVVMWVRLPMALLSSVFIAAFYILTRRLFTTRVALVAALLLAFQPLHIALSRVLHHDALNTTFMILSILPLIGYWLQGWRRSWLIVSGVMAGLAFLGKPTSWFLLPYAAALGGFTLFFRSPRSVRRLLGEVILWGGVAALSFVVFYPAMWVVPDQAIQLTFGPNVQMADEGHAQYFLGQVSDDPGPLYYPIAWLWQATPLEVIGLLILPVISTRFLSLKRLVSRPVEIALLLFLVTFFLFETIVSTKALRYFLPAFPVIAIFVAYSLLWLMDRVINRVSKNLTRWGVPLLAGLIVLIQGGLAWGHFPYYFTYYNPLVGGPATASQLMTVGWGEGLEQAADYLNHLPNARSLAVSSWYTDLFQPYFIGQQASFADDGRAQLAADYVVFYINQTQRQKPYAGLVDYFRAGKPVFVVNVKPFGWNTDLSDPADDGNTAHWVEVYKAPAAQSASGAPKVEGVARLLAYKVTGSRVTGGGMPNNTIASSAPSSSDDASFTLFLQVLGPLPEGAGLGVALLGGDRWGPWKLTQLTGEWQADHIVEWQGVLTLPPEMPAGDYRLGVALQAHDGSVIAEFPISEKDPPIEIKPRQ